MALWGTPESGVATPLAILVAAGFVLALLRPKLLWVAVACAATVAGYAWLAAHGAHGWPTLFTGLWYNDRHRIIALMPLTGVPLAALAGREAARGVGALIAAVVLPPRPRPAAMQHGLPMPFEGRVHAARAVSQVAVAGVLVVAALPSVVIVQQAMRGYYTPSPSHERSLLASGQQDFLRSLSRVLPRDAVVANSAWDGGALLYAFTGRTVVMPTWNVSQGRYKQILLTGLNQIASDRSVCYVATRLHVSYALTMGSSFHPRETVVPFFPGFEGLDHAPGFEPVAHGPHGAVLYRISRCAGRTLDTSGGTR
jgi:hypothetical protein